MLKNYNITEALLHALKDKRIMKNTLLFRGGEELNLLKKFINPEPVVNRITDVNSVTTEALLAECGLCPDVIERKKPFGSGVNRVMIILNAPRMANRIEISIHRAESVDLLKKMVTAIGLEMQECYVTNLIKCEAGSALFKPSDMVKNCTGILKKEIEIIKPHIVIVMGDILPLQGIINSSSGITWFNTEHTISLIKNPELKRPAWETLKLVRNRYQELGHDRD